MLEPCVKLVRGNFRIRVGHSECRAKYWFSRHRDCWAKYLQILTMISKSQKDNALSATNFIRHALDKLMSPIVFMKTLANGKPWARWIERALPIRFGS